MPSTVDFPTTGLTPNVTTYTLGTRTWLWNGAGWEIVTQTITGYTGSAGVGYTGSAGTNGYTGSSGVGYTGSASTVVGYTGSAGAIGYTGSASAAPFAVCNTSNIVSTGAGICTGTGGTGTNNFFAGACAGAANTTGTHNIFIGCEAGRCNTTGSNNFFAGNCAGRFNTTGSGNFFAGNCAGRCNTTGSNNVAIGLCAYFRGVCDSSDNIFIGLCAGWNLGRYTADYGNVFIGQCSGLVAGTNTCENVYIGYRAAYCGGSGDRNIYIGSNVGRYGQGVCNIFLGFEAGCRKNGKDNVFLGRSSGIAFGSGCYNFFVGPLSGCNHSDGCHNTILGKCAGYNITTGNSNTFIGNEAGFCLSTASNNFFAGQCAGRFNTASNNIFAGQCAGYCNTTGTNNIFLGQNAGNDLTATASCQIVLKAGCNELKVSTAGSLTLNGSVVNAGPAFSAYANNSTQTITSGSQQKVLFQVEEFDTNNNYASSTFTPTVAGYYQLNAEVRLDGASGTGEMMIVIWKNGAEYKRGTNQSGTQIATNFWAMQVSSLVYANGSTDYFEIYVQQISGSSITVTAVNSANITWFNGSMVRGA